MNLRFIGDFALWQALVLALLAGGAAWWLYRREVGSGLKRFVLPGLRALAVFIVVLALAGPVVETMHEVGRFGRVLVFVDTSQSMTLTDPQMDPGRKLLAAQSLGLANPAAMDLALRGVTEDLAAARRLALDTARETDPTVDPIETTEQVTARVIEAFNRFRDVDPLTVVSHVEKRGVVEANIYTDISGDSIGNLLEDAAYPGNPSETVELDRLQTASRGDNYGTRIRGYLYPPQSGQYTFWIASDDQSALSLSTDHLPDNAKVIGGVPDYTPPQTWDADPKQKSESIYLDASRKYYFEILHKQGGGDDHLAVQWQLPDGQKQVIPASALGAYGMTDRIQARQQFASLVEQFQEELIQPAQAMADRLNNNPQEASIPRDDLNSLADAAARWRQRLAQALVGYAGSIAVNVDDNLQRQLQQFDPLTRLQRIDRMLGGRAEGLLTQLARDNRVELITMHNDQARVLWTSTDPSPPAALPAVEDDRATDLSSPLRDRVGISGVGGATRLQPGERAVAVVFSDGRHNQGVNPAATAKLLGSRGIPVHTVGMGAHRRPHDIAVVRVDGPESVYIDDRVTGRIRFVDDMPADQPFTIKVMHDETVLWSKELRTNGSHYREVEFDFPIRDAAQDAAEAYDEDVTVQGVPLVMRVRIDPVEGEREPANNQRNLLVRAVLAGRKMLLVDGRPRWETRYIRNIFSRDDKWSVNALIDTTAGRETWPRGNTDESFPEDLETLYTYDGVIFGDVPPNLLRAEEIEWLRDFVDRNGGGLIFIAGRRGHLKDYRDTPLETLLPVRWTGAEPMQPDRLALTDLGENVEHLQLAGDPAESATMWEGLDPPKWVDAVEPAIATDEVLVEAVKGERHTPLITRRRIGAGRVWYVGSDETWRWRYDVGNQHMERFWNQVINRVMEPPYAVRDKYVSLDVDKIMISPGEKAQVRARLRDDQGRALVNAAAQALLYDESGNVVASAPLEPDEQSGRYFASIEGPEQGGVFSVGVSVEGYSDTQIKARTRIAVRPAADKAGEMAELTADESLLEKMAAESSGQYLREESVGELPALLSNLTQTQMQSVKYSLWDDWAWFVPVVSLLTVEWVLRRKWGLV